MTNASALSAARNMLAAEISTEPRIRAQFRSKLMQSAVLSISPTEKGKVDIDDTHDYYAMKYISRKPLSRVDE